MEIRLVRRNGDEYIEIVTEHSHLRLYKGSTDVVMTSLWEHLTGMRIEEVPAEPTEAESKPRVQKRVEEEKVSLSQKIQKGLETLDDKEIPRAIKVLRLLMKDDKTARELSKEMNFSETLARNLANKLIEIGLVGRYQTKVRGGRAYKYYIMSGGKAKAAIGHLIELMSTRAEEPIEPILKPKPTGIDALFSQEVKGKLQDIFGHEVEGKLRIEDIIRPPTSKESILYVCKDEKDSTVLKWSTAGRATDEVVILDDNKLYTFMRSKSVDNKLFYSDFNKMLKSIHGFSTNKISAIFNYVGMSKKFKTKLVRDTVRYGRQIHHEWCIEFLRDESYDEEYWTEYWRKKMVEDRKLLEGVLR